ncbi:MAG TPA: PLP-dependent cysteine synthase family protein [Terriglobia bacterium]|nr:PLP-dependent cysteine synthase family protein [Terriglobia bacterium]
MAEIVAQSSTKPGFYMNPFATIPIDNRYIEFHKRYPALNLIGNTRMVEILCFKDEFPEVSIYAKAEYANPGGSLKDRPVRRMLLEALITGKIGKGQVVLDSSSGNAGIAYAMLGAMMNVPVQIVVPGNASKERKMRIQAHGATLVQTDPIEGYDEALREGHRIHEREPERFFHCDQYANENNWLAHYHDTAGEILAQTDGKLTHFVSGIGTGGTLTGVGRRLKKEVPGVEIVQIVPEDFPGIEGLKPLEAPGDIIPKILDASVVDHKVRVTSSDAARRCALLARFGLFAGQSSGAYLQGVYETAKRIRKGTIVTILNDIGERYMSTRLWEPGA